jgi:hypothetical protein
MASVLHSRTSRRSLLYRASALGITTLLRLPVQAGVSGELHQHLPIPPAK